MPTTCRTSSTRTREPRRGRSARADMLLQHRHDPWHPTAVVAIPARDEADRISACLLALARQTRTPDGVLLFLNNCSDLTEAIARNLSAALPFALHIVSHAFAPAEAHAGNARRLAIQLAANLADPN